MVWLGLVGFGAVRQGGVGFGWVWWGLVGLQYHDEGSRSRVEGGASCY